MANSDDGRFDPEQLERGYRYFKALEHQRRGYIVIKERVRSFLLARRWELRLPDQLERAALELVDELLSVGALTLYQTGVNDENWRDYQERRERRRAREADERTKAAANEARDDERRRVDARIAELNTEREAERYRAELERQLERAELESLEQRREILRIAKPGKGGSAPDEE
jgi:hypothetical protein